jgi:hypothetical protein
VSHNLIFQIRIGTEVFKDRVASKKAAKRGAAEKALEGGWFNQDQEHPGYYVLKTEELLRLISPPQERTSPSTTLTQMLAESPEWINLN